MIENDEIFVCRKLRFYPTNEQKAYFNKCFGTSRFIYNKGVEFLNNLIKENNEKLQELVKAGCIFTTNNGQCKDTIDKGQTYFCCKHK